MRTDVIPTQGQLVTVRQRRFVVTEVDAGELPSEPLRDLAHNRSLHLVRLSSVEDDGLGEELEVIWELEPGVTVSDQAELPNPADGFDDSDRLDAFLDAVRWGAISDEDHKTLHAPFRSGISLDF